MSHKVDYIIEYTRQIKPYVDLRAQDIFARGAFESSSQRTTLLNQLRSLLGQLRHALDEAERDMHDMEDVNPFFQLYELVLYFEQLYDRVEPMGVLHLEDDYETKQFNS